LKQGRVEHALHRRGKVLLVTNVPATLCDQCGETYFKPVVGQYVMDLFQKHFTGSVDRCDVIDYEEMQAYDKADLEWNRSETRDN
jgi:YgiT-type zinc finger domain-containing protein